MPQRADLPSSADVGQQISAQECPRLRQHLSLNPNMSTESRLHESMTTFVTRVCLRYSSILFKQGAPTHREICNPGEVFFARNIT